MAVPCTDRNGAGQFLPNASELLSSSNVTLKKVLVHDDGRKLKCIISDMPTSLESRWLPEFARHIGPIGFANISDDSADAGDEEHAQQMKRRAEAVGDSQRVQGFFERMVKLHGEGGSEKQLRRLARSSMQCFTLAHRVQSSGLHEAAENDNASDDERGH